MMEEFEDPGSEWERDIDGVENALNNYVRKRKETKKLLHDLADYLEKHHKNARIAKVAGSATGLVSSGLVIGGFIASFFTFGASLVVVGVGAGLGIAAGLTTAAGFATEIITSRLTSKDAQCILEDDEKACKDLEAALKSTSGGTDSGAMYNVVDFETFWAKAKSTAFRAGTEGGAQTAFKTATAAGKGLGIAGAVFSVVTIPLDMHTMITSAISIHKKTIPEMAIVLRRIADEMPCPSCEEVSQLLSKLRDQLMQL